MSDFVQKPLNKRMNRQNPVSRIEKVERAVGPGSSASVESLSDLSTESGIIRGDLILAPASGVETEEVTSTDYTGVFMSGDGKTFDGEDWNFGGVNAGVLQFGVNALTGKAYAGAGAVVLDDDGISIKRAAAISDQNSIKFIDPSTGDILSRIAPSGTTNNALDIVLQQLAGGGSTLVLETNAPTTKSSIIITRAIGNTVSSIISISANDSGLSEIIINQAGHDVDTHILDDNGDSIASFDAGNRTMSVGGGSPISIIDSGTYTPTLTNVTNVAASTAVLCQWVRIGSIVTVSGQVQIDPTAAAATELGMSLPVASDFSAGGNCGGVACAANANAVPIAILGDSTNNRASFQAVLADTANRNYFFSFTYRVI